MTNDGVHARAYWKPWSCSVLWHLHHPIINIVIAGDFSAIATIVFSNLWKIVIYSIKFKSVILAPVYGIGKSFTDSAGPEDELVAIGFPFLQLIDKCLIWFAAFRPFAKTKSAVKINGNDFIITFHDGLLSRHRFSHSYLGRESEGLL